MRIFIYVLILLSVPMAAHAANITSALQVNGTAGQPLSYQITADNSPTSYSDSGLGSISGLTLNKTTGLISGTPTETGTFNVTVSAKGKTSTASKKVVFTIVKAVVNFTSVGSASGALSTAFSFQLAAPVTNPNYSATGLPSGLKINSNSGLISGTPTAAGLFAPTVTSSNSTTIATAILPITINGGVAPPSSLALSPSSGTLGVSYTGVFTARGSPPIAFTYAPLPPGISIMTSNGNTISGTPTTIGVTSIAVTATNAFGSATATIKFAVTALNGTPVISSALSVNGEVGEAFSYTCQAAGKSPITFAVDATQLPRGLAFDSPNQISGVPFDPGVYTVPFSAANSVGSDNQTLTITVASLAPASTVGSLKFVDNYHDTRVQGNTVASGNFNFTAIVNTPGFNPSIFNDKLNVDVTVGAYEFNNVLGNALSSGRLIPGKSALFNFTTNHNGRPSGLGNISFTLLKSSQIRIVARRKGSSILGGVKTLRAEQLTGINQLINETLPVKIQIGDTIVAAFYVQCSGSSIVKTFSQGGSTFNLSTVKLKGMGGGGPSN